MPQVQLFKSVFLVSYMWPSLGDICPQVSRTVFPTQHPFYFDQLEVRIHSRLQGSQIPREGRQKRNFCRRSWRNLHVTTLPGRECSSARPAKGSRRLTAGRLSQPTHEPTHMLPVSIRSMRSHRAMIGRVGLHSVPRSPAIPAGETATGAKPTPHHQPAS